MNERMEKILAKAESRVWNAGGGLLNEKAFEIVAELIIKQCGYYADLFETVGCPVDMDPTETKPSDFIKKQFGVE